MVQIVKMRQNTAVSLPRELVEKLREIKIETGVPIIRQLKDLIDDHYYEWCEEYYDEEDAA
jgi:predicted DNA-binding protein